MSLLVAVHEVPLLGSLQPGVRGGWTKGQCHSGKAGKHHMETRKQKKSTICNEKTIPKLTNKDGPKADCQKNQERSNHSSWAPHARPKITILSVCRACGKSGIRTHSRRARRCTSDTPCECRNAHTCSFSLRYLGTQGDYTAGTARRQSTLAWL